MEHSLGVAHVTTSTDSPRLPPRDPAVTSPAQALHAPLLPPSPEFLESVVADVAQDLKQGVRCAPLSLRDALDHLRSANAGLCGELNRFLAAGDEQLTASERLERRHLMEKLWPKRSGEISPLQIGEISISYKGSSSLDGAFTIASSEEKIRFTFAGRHGEQRISADGGAFQAVASIGDYAAVVVFRGQHFRHAETKSEAMRQLDREREQREMEAESRRRGVRTRSLSDLWNDAVRYFYPNAAPAEKPLPVPTGETARLDAQSLCISNSMYQSICARVERTANLLDQTTAALRSLAPELEYERAAKRPGA